MLRDHRLLQTDSQIKVDAMAKVIEAFQAANPNIHGVQTVVPYTDYQTKIAASFRRALVPDVGDDLFWLGAAVEQIGLHCPAAA